LLICNLEATMPTRSEVTYFGAGPAALPTDVLEKAAQALVDFERTGLGIAEHSHRSAIATKIVNEAKADLATYLDIPDDYEILFMQGGGSGEFSATVYNLVGAWVARKQQEGQSEDVLQKQVADGLKVDYLVTGSWSLKAYQEACRLLGEEHVNKAADARDVRDGKFGKIPDESTWTLSKEAAMVYYCDNETVGKWLSKNNFSSTGLSYS
jgi:phosphoserine aminotransferase